MKRIYTTREYRLKHHRKLLRLRRKSQKRKNSQKSTKSIAQINCPYSKRYEETTILAPSDFRLVDNPNDCLLFFRNIRLRNDDYLAKHGENKCVTISLKNINKIDYAAISILTAISNDLKSKRINLKGNFPENNDCKKFIIESGFLNHMVNERNKKFPTPPKSELIFFKKGSGILSGDDAKRISELTKKAFIYLNKNEEYSRSIQTIILEICGNSIEWGETKEKQWLLGVSYESNRVVFTVTDVGRGILKTLHKKFAIKLADMFSNKTSVEILEGAFNQKYGSTTQETNRNKGLPAVKSCMEKGIIQNLKVLTNDAFLHFGNSDLSSIFERGSARFSGTFYQWEMMK